MPRRPAPPSPDPVDMGPRGKYHMSRGEDERFWGNQGAGILLIAKDTGRLLLVLRSPEVNEPNTWGLPGGAIEDSENPSSAARREAREEVGFSGNLQLYPAYVFASKAFRYHNFVGVIDREFEPSLDWENSDAGWFDLKDLPSPLHFGVQALFQNSRDLISSIVEESLLRATVREALRS